MNGETRVHGKRKTKVGRVVSDRMDKTIVVSVERLARHPLYKRVVRLTTKFKAHDETNDAHIGDTVLIEESRPMSATKRWRLVAVLQRAGDHGGPADLVGEEAETQAAIHAAAHPGRDRERAAEEKPALAEGGAGPTTRAAEASEASTDRAEAAEGGAG